MRPPILVCAVIAATLAACGHPAAALQHLARPSATPAPATPATVSFPFAMPDGITPPPLRVAADPRGAGVWFWGSSTSDSRLYHWDAAAGRLSSWSVGLATQFQVGFEYGLAVDPAGRVWLGAGNRLLRLDPATGTVDRWMVPPAPVSTGRAARTPPGIGPDVDILAVAADPDGTIVVARATSRTLQIFDPATQTFTARDLPSGVIDDVAVAPDGTIAAAMTDDATLSDDLLDLVSPAGGVTSVSVESDYVTAAGASFLSGEEGVDVVSTSGGVTARSGYLADVIPTGAAAVGDGRVVVPTRTALAVVDVARGTESPVAIPVACASGVEPAPSIVPGMLGSLPMGAPPPVFRPGPCTVHADAVAADGAGDAWFIDNGGTIGELRPGDN